MTRSSFVLLAVVLACSWATREASATPPPSTLTPSPLALNNTNLTVGDTLSGQLTYTNNTGNSLWVGYAAITMLPPGGTAMNGPYVQLTPAFGSMTLPAGGNLGVSGARVFTSADPLGTWTAYGNYQDWSGWHAGPSVTFTLSAPASPTNGGVLPISSPLALNNTRFAPGDTLTATIGYRNVTGISQFVSYASITTIPPNGTAVNGPYVHLLPAVNTTSVTAGGVLWVAGSHLFTASDPLGTWTAYGSYQDANGAWHDGPTVTFTLAAGNTGAFSVTSALALNGATFAPGTTLTASMAYRNDTQNTYGVSYAGFTAIPPGGTARSGPYVHLEPPLTGVSVAPGSTLGVTCAHLFTTADPTGTWSVYGSYQDSSGAWHDTQSASFTLGSAASGSGGLSVASPLSLNGTTFPQGSTLTGTIAYRNAGPTPVSVQAISITARRPGATRAGGPFDDLSPHDGALTIQPGATVTLTASRTFATWEPVGTWEVYASYQDSSGLSHNTLSSFVTLHAPQAPVTPPIWVTGYYSAWRQNTLPPSNVDFSAMTHICHFSVVPRWDGTLDNLAHGTIDRTSAAALIDPAHAAGRRVLVTIGGGGTYSAFHAAISDPVRSTFVQNIVSFVRQNGYDGADIDMEPLTSADAPTYTAFMRELRTALTAADPTLLLTAVVEIRSAGICAPIQGQLDQINLMTYEMSGTWQDWVTWHNSPLYSAGHTFPTGGRPLPCIDTSVNDFVNAGITRGKIGVGIDFHGYRWLAATGPTQSIAGVSMTEVSYSDIMDTFYDATSYRWDPAVNASYLSLTGATVSFISYDDPTSCATKVSYAKNQTLGGVMIWDVGAGWRASQPVGQRDVMLQSIKNAAVK